MQAADETNTIVLTERQKKNFWRKIDKEGPVPDQTVPAYKGLGPCWLWMGGKSNGGYGGSSLPSIAYNAHRLSWIIHNGSIPKGEGHHGICVLHKCDTRNCIRPSHLFLGDHAKNMADMASKDRGNRLTGEKHWSHLHPEKAARGERHGSVTKPGRLPKGEGQWKAKFTADDVKSIRLRYATGTITFEKLAIEFNVTLQAIWNVVRRKTWKHVA